MDFKKQASLALSTSQDSLQNPDLEAALKIGGTINRKKLQKSKSKNNSGAWIDEERKNLRAYEYLCHIGEAKEWIEACIEGNIGEITELDENLRNGVTLAKLALFFEPTCVRKIFEDPKLQYRHSDNINYFFAACKKSGLPELFLFELTDIYDKKNIPKVIYCIHALSHFLAKKGIAPKIKNLLGQLDFTDEQLQKTENSLLEAGVALPSFAGVEGALAKELQETDEEKRNRFFNENIDKVVKCQAHVRGNMARRSFLNRKKAWRDNEDKIVLIQSHYRGHRQRLAFKKTHDHYHSQESVGKITKIQANFRARQLEKAYKSLVGDMDSISVKTIHQFANILEDGHQDVEEEHELENLKRTTVQKIREISSMEKLLHHLDIKIALLVRNRISIDDVVKEKNSSQNIPTSPLSPVGKSTNLLYSSGSLDMLKSEDNLNNLSSLRSLDKNSVHRKELYENLFYILQTQPQYLARSIYQVKQTRIRPFMDHVVLTLFNFANSAREEFLLLKFFHCTIKEELKNISDVKEFLSGNPLFIKLVVHYNRGAKERLYLRDLLQPCIKNVLGNDKLDLDIDPVSLYRKSIREEEMRTGTTSAKPSDVTKEDALKDEDVKRLLQEHVNSLKEFSSKFMTAIINSLDSMPYGIRFLAKQLMIELKGKFPDSEEYIMRVIGNLVYYRYMNPAIVAPEGFDVIEQLISPTQRKNLAEIAKCLQWIAVSKSLNDDVAYLAEYLNDFISESSKQFSQFFLKVTEVPSAEDHFQMSEFSDLTVTKKPIIYISIAEIYNTHQLLQETLEEITEKKENDPVRTLLNELGSAPASFVSTFYTGSDKSDTQGETAEESNGSKIGGDISLTLSSRFMENFTIGIVGTSNSEQVNDYKDDLIEAKGLVLDIIRIQSGQDLIEVLEKAVDEKEETHYNQLIEHDIKIRGEKRQYASSFVELKEKTKKILEDLEKRYETIAGSLENEAKLKEKLGLIKISKADNYQELLTSIGMDIRSKHRRRVERRHEIRGLNKTVENLDSKMKYLNDQQKSYEDYINSCTAQLANNRKKQANGAGGKFLLPFSLQWNHLQELKKQGKVPQFGSFIYGADHLYKKGVLVEVDGYSPKQFDKIKMTISSDETGVFTIEVSIMGVKMPNKMELKLEDLLQAQFDNQQYISLFEGAAKANVNLLVLLINKKFYN